MKMGSWPVLVIRWCLPIFCVMDLLSRLLPGSTGLQLVTWDLDPTKAALALTVISHQATPFCPLCNQPARRFHSHYQRSLGDLPSGSWRIRLLLGRHHDTIGVDRDLINDKPGW